MKKLFVAIRHSDLSSVQNMININKNLVNCVAKSPPKKDDGQSPLQIAIKLGNFEIASYLIDNGADVNWIEKKVLMNGKLQLFTMQFEQPYSLQDFQLPMEK